MCIACIQCTNQFHQAFLHARQNILNTLKSKYNFAKRGKKRQLLYECHFQLLEP